MSPSPAPWSVLPGSPGHGGLSRVQGAALDLTGGGRAPLALPSSPLCPAPHSDHTGSHCT